MPYVEVMLSVCDKIGQNSLKSDVQNFRKKLLDFLFSVPLIDNKDHFHEVVNEVLRVYRKPL